jgi:hypothetical protein
LLLKLSTKIRLPVVSERAERTLGIVSCLNVSRNVEYLSLVLSEYPLKRATFDFLHLDFFAGSRTPGLYPLQSSELVVDLVS